MALFVFLCIIAFSLYLVVLAKRGVATDDIHEILVAKRGFGAFLIFFITVGEIYGIGTLIGVPGAVYAKGSSYLVWFIGYILLAYPFGYFLNPRIWRLGKIANSATIGDFFQWRFESKGLALIVTVVSILFLLPWAQMQFAGLSIIIRYLGVEINNTFAVVVASIVAFLYVGLAGVRGSAYVAILKDSLMVLAIIIGGVVAAINMPGGLEGIFREAFEKFPTYLTVETEPLSKNVNFLISTIVFQSLGLYMFPFIFQYIFAAGSERVVRHNACIMPLYMCMYVFLTAAAFYCLVTVPGLKNPDDAYMGMIVKNVPGWVVGVCAAGGALTCMLVLADISLSVGGIVSRNVISLIKPDARPESAVVWARSFIAIFLTVSVLLMLYFPHLLLGLINVTYFGVTQFLPGVIAIVFWKQANKWGIGAGLVAGIASVFLFNMVKIVPFGLNKGMFALLVNVVVMVAITYMTSTDKKSVEKWNLTVNP
ncbi:MAG: sodium:solute symporter family protein [Syntrophobacteraceae bacterium]|nr:sodium:solute symporter family protein [Desulfobacteraceae bacterium]